MLLFLLLFLLNNNSVNGTYLDYVHPGQNKSHHYSLGKVFSDEWLGMCVYATEPELTESSIIDPDPRPVHGNKRRDKSSGSEEYKSKRGKPLPYHPSKGDETGLKVLLVSIDNRGLSTERFPSKDKHHSSYASFSAAINKDYADVHGYDYLYVTLNSTTMQKQLHSRFNCTTDLIESDFRNLKYGPASYHVGLKYMRASSWNKIPPLYHLAYEYGHMYDWILYMDTDVTLNPTFLNRSISTVLDDFQNSKTSKFGDHLLPNNNSFVQWGQTDLSKSNMLFLTNFPWRDDMPCAGVFMFRPNRVGLSQLQEWWNFNLPIKNLYDFMEQDALWYMKEADSDDIINNDGPNNGGDTSNGFDGETVTVNRRGIINNGHLREKMKNFQSKEQIAHTNEKTQYTFAINSTSMSLIYEPQMTSSVHGTNDLQFLHMANYIPQKMAYLAVAMKKTMGKLHVESAFVKHMQRIIDYHHLDLDIMGLTEKMEIHRQKGSVGAAADGTGGIPIVTKAYKDFPITYNGKADSTWHAVETTFILTPEKRRKGLDQDLGQTYNNYLIQIHGSAQTYLVLNGTKHRFPDFDTFLGMGYDTEEVLIFRDRNRREHAQERFIPEGPPILPIAEQLWSGRVVDPNGAVPPPVTRLRRKR